MKKLLLIALIGIGIVHQANAMDQVGDKDFSKEFFRELNEEYFAKNAFWSQRKKELMQQRNSLETNINLKKLNLNIHEKKLNKNMKRSTSTVGSFINILDSVTVFTESRSIANDTNDLQPIQNELITVSSELLSNLKLYRAVQELENEYPANRLKNPYLKKIKTNNPYANNPYVELASKKESKDYDEALFLLKVTKKVMEHNLSNVSWFQWLWHNSAYKNYKKSIQTLDDEIALFKDQDKVVSPFEKTVYIMKEERSLEYNVGLTNRQRVGSYVKPILTHREVFARSSMPRNMFNLVKTARE